MESLGKYAGRKALWVPWSELVEGYVPEGNWICLAIAERVFDRDAFSQWADGASRKGLLEFKGHGEGGELLHDLFDSVMVDIRLNEGEWSEHICTTWHNDETLKDAYWQCFFATALPESTDYENLNVVCSDLNGIGRSDELRRYLEEFLAEDINDGFVPSANL